MQRPYFQVRSCSQVPGLRTWTYILGGVIIQPMTSTKTEAIEVTSDPMLLTPMLILHPCHIRRIGIPNPLFPWLSSLPGLSRQLLTWGITTRPPCCSGPSRGGGIDSSSSHTANPTGSPVAPCSDKPRIRHAHTPWSDRPSAPSLVRPEPPKLSRSCCPTKVHSQQQPSGP